MSYGVQKSVQSIELFNGFLAFFHKDLKSAFRYRGRRILQLPFKSHPNIFQTIARSLQVCNVIEWCTIRFPRHDFTLCLATSSAVVVVIRLRINLSKWVLLDIFEFPDRVYSGVCQFNG